MEEGDGIRDGIRGRNKRAKKEGQNGAGKCRGRKDTGSRLIEVICHELKGNEETVRR